MCSLTTYESTRKLSSDLVDDEASRARLGKFGRTRVEDELAWSHQARAYLGVYDRLTGKAGRLTTDEQA